MSIIYALLLLLLLIYILDKNTALAYILGLFLFYNIGGYINSKALGFPGFFTVHDFGLIIAFIAGLKVNNFKIIPHDIYLRKLLKVILFFTVYQIIVSIIIKLEQPTIFAFLKQIADHRWRLFGIYFLIPTYYIVEKYPQKIINYMLFISFIILSMYYISLLMPVSLIKINYLQREIGNLQGNRLYFSNPGFSLYFIYFSIIIILKKQNIKYTHLIILTGLMGVLFILLTITRQSIIIVLGTIFVQIIIISKIEKINISAKVVKIIIYGLILILFFFGLFSNTAITFYETFKMSFMELTGKIEIGSTQSRSEFELPIMIERINEFPLIGSGFLYDFFWSYHTKWEIGISDVPLLGNIALYGIIGFILYLFRYFVIIQAMFVIKKNYLEFLNRLNSYQYLFLIFSISLILGNILFSFFNFSKDLVNKNGAVGNAIIIGILYSSFYLLRMKKNEKNNICN